ncbi:alpha-L-glutamate ligase-like protein [Desulfuromonas acetoxidans]|uniref:Alpha-L-glutamate ligase-related protein n=1 Tax=Desulfuromonas acetoxidans (strain DSM 684 / 11070) TaxID=281689 RepID=Q1K463_DESA6|nr:alpha-L-glutamate ligase-like protein [Desulfuromonas acetoxidans]EAT17240.1 Alpha-L-glutamate ligase-related protein [Desulfuromonas acetoxidans DSM 684]MBF0645888.1 alpha-L-glutamate ligase-like protein [Desulfuromonas acetoxidans]NVD24170.1 alpha-L-glutamate ligase-like protein [Desulfuromonas acetoxidans]NVE15057.1 alpha-L-glutamate ligase-like protein [Desulfuromonas acetoxidans]
MWFKSLRDMGILGMNARNIEFIGRYNQRKLYPLVDDKLKTKKLAQRFDIPAPKLHFVIREQHRLRNAENLFRKLDGFAIKPAKGSGGKGILVIKTQEQGRFVTTSGVRLGLTDIKRHISNILAGLYSLAGTPDVAIVEELVEFSDMFTGFSHQGVPDIRIIVFQGYPVMAMLRLATQRSDGKANLHQGAIGVGLDIATGTSLDAVLFSLPLEVHPDTGRILSEIDIPGWQEILYLAARCHDMTGLGYIGTDIVLDSDNRPLLLELNARPGLSIQVANGQGLLPRLRHIEKLKRKHDAAQERVNYVLTTFGATASL